jgi:hypothetical protein
LLYSFRTYISFSPFCHTPFSWHFSGLLSFPSFPSSLWFKIF